MIKQTFDIEKISEITNHKDVIDLINDDGTKGRYTPVISPQVLYLIDDTCSGVIRVDPLNSVSCTVHIATLPRMWGAGHGFVRDAIAWGFKNTLYQKIVAIIPEYNNFAIKLVSDLSFKKEGVLTKSFLKNWKMHDQFIYGLNKGELNYDRP